MNIFDKDWIKLKPIDKELKCYMLKNYIAKIDALIESGMLYSAMLVVETELHNLYNLKYDRDILELNDRTIIGINIDLMELDYEYPNPTEEDNIIYEICDTAIEYLEKIYRKIRDFWRGLETKCIISEIPDVKPTKSQGYIMCVLKDSEEIQVYHYIEPVNFKMNWNDFKIDLSTSIPNTTSDITKFILDSEKESDLNRFFRFDSKVTGYSKEETMFPLMKYMLFNRIKHGI